MIKSPQNANGSSNSTLCPECGAGLSSTLDTRVSGVHIRRRRMCALGHRWTTLEVNQLEYEDLRDEAASASRMRAQLANFLGGGNAKPIAE